jgi:hypothetical protein
MTQANLHLSQLTHSFSSVVILSEAKDLRRQRNRLFAVEQNHVRAQHRCAPASPGVSFTPAPFLTFSSDRIL